MISAWPASSPRLAAAWRVASAPADVAHVVLDAPDEQREPTGEAEHFPVLGEGQARVQ
jgi:hypothetical protein